MCEGRERPHFHPSTLPPTNGARGVGIALLLCLLALGAAAAAPPAQAQAPVRTLQLGLGVVPGFGLQAGYLMPRSFYTLEGIFSTDVSPRFAGGEGTILVVGGFGGALRILNTLRAVGVPRYPGYELDVGLRVGPGLNFFLEGATRAEKNTRFELQTELFVRVAGPLTETRTFFVEVGSLRPIFRAGLWFRI